MVMPAARLRHAIAAAFADRIAVDSWNDSKRSERCAGSSDRRAVEIRRAAGDVIILRR
jgi:hypothetical protein